ncbi:putative DnaJ domain-containing protein [Medicago truncatula]|uniref:Putative DnaJ domain-containing protein n=1 Tax=Medicago truncatula TaxID=3880 RepID=A0A396K2H3_MEDTR|nr:uncharacterized protein LOC25484676 [Medicago truncatula]RHN80717.1 putative DnaJ domain-containing protein [Medicago truncatula]
MECNKDDAVKAKQLAETKMQRGEFVDALKFANKAKRLYADVENIAQILAVCEVHNAALNKLSKYDMDWYGVLQTEKLSEEAIIKKQYKKLALLLHPDKNKSAGAEAAFKLIGEANRVLSDKATRSLYDIKVKAHVRAAASKTSSHPSNGKPAANQVPNATKHQKKCSSNSPSLNPHLKPAQPTFWTMCRHCNTKFQFYIYVINKALLCQKCKNSFVALAMNPQTFPSFVQFGAPKKVPTQDPPKPACKSNGGTSVSSGCADTFVPSYPSCMKTCANGVGKQHKDEKSKDGFIPVSKPMKSQSSNNVGSKRVRQPEPDSTERFNTGNDYEKKGFNVRENDADPSRLNVRRSSRQKQHVSYKENHEDDHDAVPSKKPRQDESSNNAEVESKNVSEDSHFQGDTVLESDVDPPNSDMPSSPETIVCPDPDFNNFEKDKADDCFAVNQLWAIYDTTDAMPRFYALVKKVTFPFKLQITWLEADPDEDSEVHWYNADLPIACGKFKLANSQKTTDRGMFSHQIQFIKGNEKDSYLVLPKKGETWAIFRNWDINWSSNPENYLKREFAYVEILSDYTENLGIQVAYLGKVKGFTSLFEKTGKNGDNTFTFSIPPNQTYRFSHQIPSFRMSGDEREGVPRGCFEFDPAALPTEIFEAEKDSSIPGRSREKV